MSTTPNRPISSTLTKKSRKKRIKETSSGFKRVILPLVPAVSALTKTRLCRKVLENLQKDNREIDTGVAGKQKQSRNCTKKANLKGIRARGG